LEAIRTENPLSNPYGAIAMNNSHGDATRAKILVIFIFPLLSAQKSATGRMTDHVKYFFGS
jgi:hypothetical protein